MIIDISQLYDITLGIRRIKSVKESKHRGEIITSTLGATEAKHLLFVYYHIGQSFQGRIATISRKAIEGISS
jgi:hypothetical protein